MRGRKRERERERERDACDVNRYHAEIASDHAVRRPNASTRSEPVECSCTCIRQAGLVFERSSSRQWSSD